ncbi:MAG TPA: wax ester/triacylglycerol synthase family O-acyltransferase [Rubrivivax sp.]|nr:wax ester/triacylglycerol synthase family O-acyltransferase [Rubrivivax sp.]
MKLKPMNVLDAGLLMMESPETPMHIGGVQVLKPPAGARRDHVRKLRDRMMQFPADGAPFNYRLARTGGRLGLPAWEVLDHVDLEEHVFHHALPYPGGERELLALVSRLNSGPLDRSRPLWEQHLIEGLEGGRYATYTRVHHALMDGQWGIRLAHATTSADPRVRGLPPFWAVKFDGEKAAARPTERAMKAVLKAATKAGKDPAAPGWWARQAQDVQAGLETVAELRKAFGRLIESFRHPADDGLVPMYTAPRTLLDGHLTARRELAVVRLDLRRIKAIAQARGVKINDVVLSLCGGALRRYLAERESLPDKPLIVGMPIAVARPESDAGGNATVTTQVSLATHVADPLERLATVHGSSLHAKELIREMPSVTALTVYMVVVGLPYILAQIAGQAERVHVQNLVLSNVSGLRERRYVNGARIEAEYPMSLLVPGQAMNITVISQADELHVAVLVCPSLVPQPQRVADAIADELDALENAGRPRAPAARRNPRKHP